MAEEKVGFGFEFGIKGDKEVKRGLEDIIRLMGTAGDATNALAGVLGKAGGLLEFGKASGVIALAATAMATFAYKSAEAGENLRRTRYELGLLSKVPVSALSDADLGANESAVIEQFRNLGLEAGNTFQLSFLDRLKNFGQGAYAVNWDVQAAIANLFGAHMHSYEQDSDESRQAQNQIAMDQKVMTERIKMAEQTQQSLAAIHRKTAMEIAELYSFNYGGKPGQPGSGVMPEGFVGRTRQREIRTNTESETLQVAVTQTEFLKKQLDALRNAPLPRIPGTDPALNLQDTAKRASDIAGLEAKINDQLDRQYTARQNILEIELEQRQMARDFIKSQNYGSWRTLGGGGVTTVDPRFLAASEKIIPSKVLPTDVGYETKKNPEAASAIAQAQATLNASSAQTTSTAANTFKESVDNFKDTVGKLIVGKDTGGTFEKAVKVGSHLKGMDAVAFDVGAVTIKGVHEASSMITDFFIKFLGNKAANAVSGAAGSHPDAQKKVDADGVPLTSNRYKLPFSSFHNLTASNFRKENSISDSDYGRYTHGDFPRPKMAGDIGPISPAHLKRAGISEAQNEALKTAQWVSNYQSSFSHKLMTDLPKRNADVKKDPRYAASLKGGRYDSTLIGADMAHIGHGFPNPTASWTTQPFHHGSLRGIDPLGDMNKRVRGWNSPAHAFGSLPGSLQTVDVLKSIDKNIGQIGTPTLRN